MVQFLIVNESLKIIDDTKTVVFIAKKDVFAISQSLYGTVPIADLYNLNLGYLGLVFTRKLSECLDPNGDVFTVSSFITFVETYLGFNSGGIPQTIDLQDVTDNGNTTTNSIEASSFIKSGGTSSEILMADGSIITAGANITISGGAISSSGGGITELNGLTVTTQNFATSTSGTDFNIVSSGNTHRFDMPSAGTSARGVVTVNDQSFSGLKNFTDNIIVNTIKVWRGNNNSATNIGIGLDTLIDSTGNQNTVIGYEASSSLLSASSFATALGYQALKNILGNNNTGIGHSAGSLITNGFQNTFIGALSGGNIGQLISAQNSTAIGYNAFTTKNNQVVLGNALVTETVLRGKIDLDSVPTTSAGAYDILTRNISTGIIEKILSSSLSPTFIDYSATSTVVGWTTFTQKTIRYSVIGKLLIVEYFISGTSNATTTSFTLPQASATVSGMIWANNNQTQNNAVSYMGYSNVLSNSSTATFGYYPTGSTITATWTASGTKTIRGLLTIEIA